MFSFRRSHPEADRAWPEVLIGGLSCSSGSSFRLEVFDSPRPDPEVISLSRPEGLARSEEKFFLINHRAIPFYMPWRHPDSCITDKVPTNFNQSHVDQLKAHIVKLRDIPEGVLVWSGLSRVCRNPMCDPVLRGSDNTVMSIHEFLCMPSLDKATTSTNAAKKTRSSQKVSGAGSSGLAAEDGVEQTDDGTLDDDGQCDGSEFAMEDIGNLNDVSQYKEVGAHVELSEGVKRATRASFHASHAPNTQPLDADVGADEIASDGNVDPYYEARVSNTAGDVLERDLLPFILGPYTFLILMTRALTALDRFPTPAETYRLRELSSVELSDLMSTQTIKKQSADLKQQNESTVHANEEVSRFTAKLAVLKSRSISVGVERGLRMDRTDENFKGLFQKVAGFIPNAKQNFDRVIADTTFPFLDKTSSATASLRANTHIRHSTSSSGTFGHTSTPKHLKKKKKSVEK
uniref:Uncharacterized protein n=1 Tax=Tanacetum cinerariifolium TaxID=118510 RepID=A0A6L2MCI0_TANCI|nr:hypothetical protein [Tanacetum cinerariifolium]